MIMTMRMDMREEMNQKLFSDRRNVIAVFSTDTDLFILPRHVLQCIRFNSVVSWLYDGCSLCLSVCHHT